MPVAHHNTSAASNAKGVPASDGIIIKIAPISLDFIEELIGEERALINPQATDSRKSQIATGRHVAHAAQLELGITQISPITRCKSGAPVFANGIVGSISHSQTHAVAIAARSSSFRGVGIDIENTSRKISIAAQRRIALDPELAWVNAARSEEQSQIRALQIFCAKEALYKAFYGILEPRELKFKAVVLRIPREEEQCEEQDFCKQFYAEFVESKTKELVHFNIIDDQVLAWVSCSK